MLLYKVTLIIETKLMIISSVCSYLYDPIDGHRCLVVILASSVDFEREAAELVHQHIDHTALSLCCGQYL